MDRFSLRFAKACAAWLVVKAWPDRLPRWMFWILPSVGDYAYWDEPAFVEQRRVTKHRAEALNPSQIEPERP